MGELIVHAGPLGHGQMVKLINNAVAATNAAVRRRGAAGRRPAPGVDLDALVEVMGAGSGGSAMLDAQGRADARARLHDAVQARAHAQGRRLCLEEGQALGVPFPTAAYAREILTAAMGRGLGDDDFAALIEAARGRRRRPAVSRP